MMGARKETLARGKAKRRMNDKCNWYDIIDLVSRHLGAHASLFITISDIKKMKEGDQLELLLIDRNFGDCNRWDNQYAIYTHRKDCHGTIIYFGLHEQEFCWHLEYKDDHWMPLKPDGCLPSQNTWVPNILQGEDVSAFIDRSWNTYPESTRVGYRGPCMQYGKAMELVPLDLLDWDD